MNFLREEAPPRGVALPVAPGIRRIVADNPGPMTYRGTNTYLIDWDDGVAVLDPGPEDPAHTKDILREAGAPIRALILTHGHHDHSGGLPALREALGHEATGARLHGFAESSDVVLQDGDTVGPLRAMHTPGHAADHLCFAGPGGVVFSGDHVMSWSSTVVGGTGGDMAAYFRSLERLIAVDASLYLPGHGPPLPEPRAFATALLEHRRAREQAILAMLEAGPAATGALVRTLYRGLDPSLARPAEANVVAHLRKLVGEGRVVATDAGWAVAASPG